MVLTSRDFTQRLREFVTKDDFRKVFRVTEEQRLIQKDLEYAVRLVVHTFKDFPKGRDVRSFTMRILEVMMERSPDEVLAQVGWSVETLQRLLGDKALIPPDDRPEEIAQRFSLRALEVSPSAITRNKGAIAILADPDAFIREKVTGFWQQSEVADMSAPGLRGSVRLQRSVTFGSKWFCPDA